LALAVVLGRHLVHGLVGGAVVDVGLGVVVVDGGDAVAVAVAAILLLMGGRRAVVALSAFRRLRERLLLDEARDRRRVRVVEQQRPRITRTVSDMYASSASCRAVRPAVARFSCITLRISARVIGSGSSSAALKMASRRGSIVKVTFLCEVLKDECAIPYTRSTKSKLSSPGLCGS
jgi:hypothetical protein